MARHQKRVSAPTSWPIPKKTNKWVVGANAGSHSMETGIPLLLVVRDMLKIANNAREARKIIHDGGILVDGVVRRDYKYITGLFDIISIPALNVYYRVLQDASNRLKLQKEEQGALKLCRINNKTIVKNGAVQLNLHDGTNILASNDCRAFDTVMLSTPDKKITKHIPRKAGNLAMIVGGKHSGEIGTIKHVRKVLGSGKNMVGISNDKEFETIADYVFVIGESTPEIKVIK
jgi:small subunit ribosomal protein S4e